MTDKKLVICEEIEQVLEVTQNGKLTQTKYVYVRDYTPPDTQGALDALNLLCENSKLAKETCSVMKEVIYTALTRPSRESKDDIDNKTNDR